MKNSKLPLLALWFAAGCTGEAPERPVPVADVRELMISVLEPMVETGRLALDAVDRRNADAVFDAGAEVYYACRDCHARYATGTLRPSDPHGGGGR